MTDLKLGDNCFVVIWRDGIGERNPIGHPIDNKIVSPKQKIEVPNGSVDTVVQIRVEKIDSDRVIGRIVDHFESDVPKWEDKRDILTNRYDLETEVSQESGGRRLMIMATSDYENQWQKQKKAVFDQITDRD